MNPEISIAGIEDLAKILELQKQCYQEEAALYDDYTIPPLTQSIAAIVGDFKQGTVFLKAVVDNEIVASVRANTKSGTTYIGRLIVKKEFQNRKLGQTLMHSIESLLSNCERYELFTGSKSEKNLYLYQKLGYIESGRENISDNLNLVYFQKVKLG